LDIGGMNLLSDFDPWLRPYQELITKRAEAAQQKELELTGERGLVNFANGHLYFGLHKIKSGWLFREWAPNATSVYLIGEFTNWQEHPDYALIPIGQGIWQIELKSPHIEPGTLYRLSIHWPGGHGHRIPSYAKRVIQDPLTYICNAQFWSPPTYTWKNSAPSQPLTAPLIYEAHVGMSSEEPRIANFTHFRQNILPHIAQAGYNTIQLMAIQEHPYYGSFGYHVSNFFAVSSRFGTPEELKALVDEAHGLGLRVIMDLVHSHSVKNENEGLGLFDGTPYQYFHGNERRNHQAWDSLCFDYGKNQVLHFLLSNLKFWIEEYHFDGFRFDGVTSMLYYDHGLSRDFTDYPLYFDHTQDEDALTYLYLANKLIHEINPAALTVAEEMSGYPGVAAPLENQGLGFDYRLAMGIPDYWIKIIKEKPDESWNIGNIFYELVNKRSEERVISYCESHDQALVGDKTLIFRLIDKDMYWHMDKASQNHLVDRGLALHKMIRLITLSTAGGGYLNFMGNEFGHPEWIDFPRAGNGWSYTYARRQWNLAHNPFLRYHYLLDFDRAMIQLASQYQILASTGASSLYEDESSQVLIYMRGDLIFAFNFNPTQSFFNYTFPLNIQGAWAILLNSDSKLYGGSNRIDESVQHICRPLEPTKTQSYLQLYLPSRTALVLHKTS